MLLIISLLMAVAYIAAVIIKDKKLPDSISALVYALPSKWQWVWTVWLWAISLLMCIPLIDMLPEAWKSLGFFTLACLGFVGAMPIIYKEHNKTHNVFAAAGAVLSQMCCCLVGDLVVMLHWWVLYLLLLGLMWICRCQRYWCLVAEGWCLLAIAYILFYHCNGFPVYSVLNN